MAFFTEFALSFGAEFGKDKGGEALERLTAESGNLEAMLLLGLDSPEPVAALEAVYILTDFFRFSSSRRTVLLERARTVALNRKLDIWQAKCGKSLGHVALSAADNETARRWYEEAREVFSRICDEQGQVECLNSLGEIELRETNYERANKLYEEAFGLPRQLEDPIAMANSIKGLADINREGGTLEVAEDRYKEALALYRKAGYQIGVASCQKALGDIVLAHNDRAAARKVFEDQLPIYRDAGDLLGEANCLNSLGDVYRLEKDYVDATKCFSEAENLGKRLGNKIIQANSIKGFAEIDRCQSEYPKAEKKYARAIQLYAEAKNVLGEALCLRALALLELAWAKPRDAREHLKQSLCLFRQEKDSMIQAAHNLKILGDAAMKIPDYPAAQNEYEEALLLYRTVDPHDLLAEARCLLAIAELAEIRDDPRAKDHYETAVKMFLNGKSSRDAARCNLRLGHLVEKSGTPRRASRDATNYYNSAIELLGGDDDSSLLVEAFLSLAKITPETGKKRDVIVQRAREAAKRANDKNLVERLEKEFPVH